MTEIVGTIVFSYYLDDADAVGQFDAALVRLVGRPPDESGVVITEHTRDMAWHCETEEEITLIAGLFTDKDLLFIVDDVPDDFLRQHDLPGDSIFDGWSDEEVIKALQKNTKKIVALSG
jgi:hypothetical protein